MKKLLIILALGLSLAACGSEEEVITQGGTNNSVPSNPADDSSKPYSAAGIESSREFSLTPEEATGNESLNRFSYEFAVKSLLDEEAGPTNTAVSPLSLTGYLGVVANSVDDRTTESICSALGIANPTTLDSVSHKLIRYLVCPENGAVLELANSLWYSEGLTPSGSYTENMAKTYYADINPVDFSTKEGMSVIDSWVSDKTHGLIPTITEFLSPTMADNAIVLNALYFSGEWLSKFIPEDTRKEAFYASERATVCDMMHNTLDAAYKSGDGYELAEISFRGHTTISFLLPAENTAIEELKDRLLAEGHSLLTEGKREVEATLSLPKFSIESCGSVSKTLAEMNLTAGGRLEKAGLDIALSPSIFQKSVINIDEEGAKLAAVTFGDLVSPGDTEQLEKEKITISLNRPFLFFVRNSVTGSILMGGRVERP